MEPVATIHDIYSALARMTDVSQDMVRRRAEFENWFYNPTQGGKTKGYLTAMLPVDVKIALKANTLPTVKEDKLPAVGIRRDQKVYREQEEKAFAKAELARAYVTHMEQAGYGKKNKIKRLFLENYNLGEAGLLPAVYRQVGKVDLRGKTVEGWAGRLKKNNWEPMCLVDMRGFSKRGKRAVTPEQMEIILSIVKSPYNTPGKPVLEIIHQAKSIMVHRGLEILSDSTYSRWLTKDWIPYHYDEWIWWREGDKGLNDKVMFWVQRDYDKIEPGDLLVADGHVLNFEIINPFTQRPKRMMLILFYDAKSNYPLGWEIMPTENTEAISSALRRAIIRLGKMPTAVYIDNGRAFKGEYFMNKDLTAEFKGLYERLGIKPIIAKPYHGQSKVVERFFRVFGELERLAPSFVGECIANKPAHMNRGEKLRQKLHIKITRGVTPTLEDAHRAIALWFDKYASTRQGSNSHIAGQSPSEVMVPGPGVNPVELRCLMMSEKKRMIRRRGIKMHGGDTWYYSPELYGRKHEVFIRYDLQNQDSILVYDATTEEFICEAFKMAKVHPMVSIMGTDEDKAEFERQMKLKHGLRKQTVSSAREIVETQVIPEARKRIEQAGFSINDTRIGSVKALPEPIPTQTDEEINKDLAELESVQLDDIFEEYDEDYTPEVINEAEQVFSELKELPESDRFEKLTELEVKGWLIPREHQAWMKYFEQTKEYERHRDYFEEYRTKMVMTYGSDHIGAMNQ